MSFFSLIRRAFTNSQYLEKSESKNQVTAIKKRNKRLRRRRTSKGHNFSEKPSRYRRNHLGHH